MGGVNKGIMTRYSSFENIIYKKITITHKRAYSLLKKIQIQLHLHKKGHHKSPTKCIYKKGWPIPNWSMQYKTALVVILQTQDITVVPKPINKWQNYIFMPILQYFILEQHYIWHFNARLTFMLKDHLYFKNIKLQYKNYQLGSTYDQPRQHNSNPGPHMTNLTNTKA